MKFPNELKKIEQRVEGLEAQAGTPPGQDQEYLDFDYDQNGTLTRFRVPPADSKFWADVVLVYGPKTEAEHKDGVAATQK